MLQASRFDAVVICTGAKPVVPPVEGVELPHVVQAVNLLRDPALADSAEKIVIVGGGEVGCETAYLLACERGKQVTVVEMLPYLMKEVCTANRGYLIYYLKKRGVELFNCARLDRVKEHEVLVMRNVSPTVPDPYVSWRPVLPENVKNPLARPIKVEEERVALDADLVVLAVGLRSDNLLHEACVRAGVAPEIHAIGDAFSPGRIFEATKAGYAVGSWL